MNYFLELSTLHPPTPSCVPGGRCPEWGRQDEDVVRLAHEDVGLRDRVGVLANPLLEGQGPLQHHVPLRSGGRLRLERPKTDTKCSAPQTCEKGSGDRGRSNECTSHTRPVPEHILACPTHTDSNAPPFDQVTRAISATQGGMGSTTTVGISCISSSGCPECSRRVKPPMALSGYRAFILRYQ